MGPHLPTLPQHCATALGCNSANRSLSGPVFSPPRFAFGPFRQFQAAPKPHSAARPRLNLSRGSTVAEVGIGITSWSLALGSTGRIGTTLAVFSLRLFSTSGSFTAGWYLVVVVANASPAKTWVRGRLCTGEKNKRPGCTLENGFFLLSSSTRTTRTAVQQQQQQQQH